MGSSYIVYRATSPSGKVYVGYTGRALPIRRSAHESDAMRLKHRPFYAALLKYGFATFVWEVVSRHETKGEALVAERDAIAAHRSSERAFGYNLTTGGETVEHSAATRERIRQTLRRRYAAGEMDHVNARRPRGEANHAFGRQYSREERDELARLKGGRQFAGYKGETLIGVWWNQHQAARELGLHPENVRAVLHGKAKTSRGYVFRYI